MKNKKVSLAAGTALCALTVLLTVIYAALSGAFVSAAKTPPCDAEDCYAKDAILSVCERGLMTAYIIGEDAYFYPTLEVSRGELAKTLAIYLGLDPAPYEKRTLGFADEAELSADLAPYVRAVLAGGYMQLAYDYAFHAGDAISREETAYIIGALCNAAVSAGKSEKFSDFEEIHPYFEVNAKKVVDFEIMIGYPDGTFRPHNALTREELALILCRLDGAEHFKKRAAS